MAATRLQQHLTILDIVPQADLSSVFSLVLGFLENALLSRKSVKGIEGLLDKQQWKNRVRLGPSGKQYHGVCDIVLEGESRWQCLQNTEVQDATQGETAHHIAPQDSQSLRLTVVEEGSDGPKDTFTVATRFMQLSSTWQQASRDVSNHVTTYETAWPVKTTRLIRLWEEDQRKCVRITCNTYTRERRSDGLAGFYSAKQISIELELLDASYVAVRSKENLKQLFLLQFHHACLKLFIEFLNTLETDEIADADDTTTDPRSAELGLWKLKTITKRSYEYRDLAEMCHRLISTTECLIVVTRSISPVVDTLVHTNKFMVIDMELRGFYREANEQLQKFSDRLDHDLKYLELARNINQTRGVQKLTLLATIFLPLSLAAGVLSMQTRFRDLGTLVYDFFGVVVLLAAIVLIIMILLSLVAVVKELDSKVLQIESYRESFRVKVLLMVNIALFVFGCLVLSSFLIGMFKDVSLGATILGYGVAAICGLCMILFLSVVGVFLTLYLCDEAVLWEGRPRPRTRAQA